MATPEPEKCKHGYRCVCEGDSSDYKCSSCLLLLREPCTTTCCEKQYCKAYLEGKEKCPNCQRGLHFAYSKFQDKSLQNLDVVCSEKECKCPWRGKVREFAEHITCCEYVRVPCEKCHQAISKNQLETHRTQDCPERLFSCPHCQLRKTYQFITEVHIPVCSRVSVECPNRCGLEGGRMNMDGHLNNECPLRPMDCPFSPMGCRVKLRRDEEEDHLKESTTTHLSALASYTLQMDAKLNELVKTVEEFKKKRDKKISDLEGEVSSLRSTIDSLSQTINNQPENDISPPESQAEPYRMGTDIEHEKDAQIQQLNQSLDAYKEQQARLELRVSRIEQQTPPAGAFETTVTVEGLTEKKLNQECYSVPIFRDQQGLQHKLNFTIWPNGQKEGKNKYVSLWLEQEDRRQNNPPAHIFIYVEILNQTVDDCHIQLPCHFPILSHRYIGVISNTAISHEELEYNHLKGTQYLVHDTLKIRLHAYIKPLQPSCWNNTDCLAHHS